MLMGCLAEGTVADLPLRWVVGTFSEPYAETASVRDM
jgi:hypothetical protein